ncbi:hypothetical protein [Sciscionella sediminilitoris]|uniref:hypothetical protein n=1 Tax=Sciscionella sediminilitoris TaxID=1445613 RepID=UPI000AE1841B|nr:hypothetical protein [Sciscionella sp. SE31]
MELTAAGPVHSPARTLFAELAAGYSDAGRLERACYRIAAVLVLLGLLHLLVQAVLGGPWAGPVSWRKPAEFGLAFGVTLFAVTAASTRIAASARSRAPSLGLFAIACTVEVLAITVQAWRGVPSHFNTTTPIDSVFAMAAAFGGGVIVLSILTLTIAAIRKPLPAETRATRIAVLCGFFSLVLALLIGAAMIAIGERTMFTVSLEAAYWAATVLVPAHAVAMQGILVLPALAWLTTHTGWSAPRRTRIIMLGSTGYLLCTAVVVIEAAFGIEPTRFGTAPIAATALALLGLLTLVGTGIVTIKAVCTRQRHT